MGPFRSTGILPVLLGNDPQAPVPHSTPKRVRPFRGIERYG